MSERVCMGWSERVYVKVGEKEGESVCVSGRQRVCV